MNEQGGLNILDAFAVKITSDNLAAYFATITLEDLAYYAKNNKDLAAELPVILTIPNIPVAKNILVRYLKNVNGRLYEHIRLRLSAQFPTYAALMGLDSVNPWYIQNMDRIKKRLIDQLENKGGDDSNESGRQDDVNSDIGISDSGGRGTPVLLPYQDSGIGHDLSGNVPNKCNSGPYGFSTARQIMVDKHGQ